MPIFKFIHDRDSEILPHGNELLESGEKGARDRGLPENKTGELNECQGHDVDIQE